MCFCTDNQAAVWCIKHHGFSQMKILLTGSASLDLAHSHKLCLTAQYLPGSQNICADALSWFTMSSVEWCLH